jgi:frataxin-like iron-binding protein CyaY
MVWKLSTTISMWSPLDVGSARRYIAADKRYLIAIIFFPLYISGSSSYHDRMPTTRRPYKSSQGCIFSSSVVLLIGRRRYNDVSRSSLQRLNSLPFIRRYRTHMVVKNSEGISTSRDCTIIINKQSAPLHPSHPALKQIFDMSTSIITGYIQSHKQTKYTSRTHKLTVNQQTALRSFWLDKSTNTGFRFFTSNPSLHQSNKLNEKHLARSKAQTLPH